ncbi:UDP-N-acetylglucosamine 1-carboxyvinyltransferase [Patescibacteria group bacterium]|nr:UDP-N-acetylglucosamine 1-carboxyvinyltransferase [Patescibacteria group bacterium]
MSSLIIKGERKLEGKIKVSGMKNAATPILAACLLAQKKCTIKNVPDIADVRAMLQILESLGLKISYKNHTVIAEPKGIRLKNFNQPLVKKLRSSILILGPLLARLGEISLPEPGGCIIGKRPIDTHLYGFEKLGAGVRHKDDGIFLKAKKLKGNEVVLPEFSVTATENLIMAACLAEGRTIIKLAAIEPHVQDLIRFLNKMGAKVKLRIGHTVVIDGVKQLSGAEHTLLPDNIEAGTFAIAALITKGRITLQGVEHGHMDAVYSALERAGADLKIERNNLTVSVKNKLQAFKLQTMPYPGFPTDLQAPFGALATQCHGTSLIHDPMFEGRMGHINELVKMGANATVCDPHRVLITGPTKLRGTEIKGLDLRAGATLVLAGLIARGTTTVEGAENLDRGYERFDGRLNSLGADIKRQ